MGKISSAVFATVLGEGSRAVCERRDGSPGLHVPKSTFGFFGRKTALNEVDVQSSGAV